MDSKDLEAWQTDPVTVHLLGLLERLRQRREDQYKQDWFDGQPPTDMQMAALSAFGDILANLSGLLFEDYERLRSELDE